MKNLYDRDIFFNKRTVFILLGVGLFFSGLLIFLFAINFFKLTTNINSSVLSDFGSVFGGIVGTIFNLAGLLLIYLTFSEQKKAILIQLSEIKQSKYESYITRHSSIIVNLLDRLDKNIESFSLSFTNSTKEGKNETLLLKGLPALNFLANVCGHPNRNPDDNPFPVQIISRYNYESIYHLFCMVHSLYKTTHIEELQSDTDIANKAESEKAKLYLVNLISTNLNRELTNSISVINALCSKEEIERKQPISEHFSQKTKNKNKITTLDELVADFSEETKYLNTEFTDFFRYMKLASVTFLIIAYDKDSFIQH